jgi:DNA-binding protein
MENDNNNNITLLKHKIKRENLKNEIYISRKRKSNNIYKFYFKRVKKLFNDLKYNEIFICGLGACVNEAIRIAVFVKEAMPNIKIEDINTETITHFDEYINEETKERIDVKNDRKSNLIKIKLIKKN